MRYRIDLARVADGCREFGTARFGQFTQTDPIGIAGGLNTYGYANGDPINFSDPFGLSAEESGEGDGSDPCEPWIDDREKYAECEKGAKPLKTVGRRLGDTEAAQQLFECVGDHYGSGSSLGPVRVTSYAGALPVDKMAAGVPVMGSASPTTNAISATGQKIAPGLKMSDVGLPRLLGSNRVFGVLGRANLLLAAGITSYDITSVGMCAAGGG